MREVRNGLSPKPANEPPGIPILRISAVRQGRVHLHNTRYHRASDEPAEPYLLRNGDLLFVRYNGNPAFTAACGMVRGLVSDCVYPDKLIRVRLDEALAEPAFVELAMALPETRQQLSDFIKTAAGQYGISVRDLRRICIPLPPLAEQRRIVARIEALFARTRRARADLERVAPLARHHRDRTLATAFSHEWPQVRIDSVAIGSFDGPFGSNLKSTDYTPSGTRVVRLENIGHLCFIADKETFIPDEKAARLARHRLQPHDVLFSSFIDKEVRVCLFPDHLPTVAINKADCFSIRVDPARCDPRFLALRLAAPETYEDMRDAVHGATRPRVGLSDVKRYEIGLPSLTEQTAIIMQVEHAHASTDLIEHEATRAFALVDRLEQSILARAFRGELVPQDPDDEPAETTLARLRAAPNDSPAPRRGRRRLA
jgi:type I restriction enzyme S subunit